MRTRERSQRKHPRTPVHVRIPDELLPFVEGFGVDRSAGVVRAVDLAKDVRELMGVDWGKVEVRAYLEQITEGEALGKFALEAIRSKPRK